MKKLVLAASLIALSAPILAQTAVTPSVTVYGKMRQFIESEKVGTGESITKLTNATSRLGFRGTEDLGDGLKAEFIIETAIGADSPTGAATSLGDRRSLVGLSNSWGSVHFGRDRILSQFIYDRFDAMGNFASSSIGTIHATQGIRVSNAAFVTVRPFKGSAFHYQHSASETAGGKDVKNFGADYAAGPFAIGYARFDNGTTSESDTLGVSFRLGSSTTLFGVYSDDKVVNVETKGKTVGIRQQINAPLALVASYGEKEGMKATNLGANYALSKRTNLHVRYRNEDATLASENRKTFGIGIDHNF